MKEQIFLGDLTRCYEDSICISGTHGKTTTTSMVSLCFLEGLKDPSIQVGAYLKQIDGNYKVGNSEHFVIEACEYVESYLKLFPKTEIILNIDNEKKPSEIEFYVNKTRFTPSTKGLYGKIITMDITKYLENGKNTITFVPLKEADKDKTVYFWVEIEK